MTTHQHNMQQLARFYRFFMVPDADGAFRLYGYGPQKTPAERAVNRRACKRAFPFLKTP